MRMRIGAVIPGVIRAVRIVVINGPDITVVNYIVVMVILPMPKVPEKKIAAGAADKDPAPAKEKAASRTPSIALPAGKGGSAGQAAHQQNNDGHYDCLSHMASPFDRFIIKLGRLPKIIKAALILCQSVLLLFAAAPDASAAGKKRAAAKGKYHETIMHYARERGLPSSLLKAIIKTESNFHPRAVSPKGAKGLMQLMPGVCYKYGVSDPFDAEQNIRAGAAFFRDMLERFRSLPLALAAYNAGPEAVEKHQGVPPYTETRLFIKMVYRNYNYFRKEIDPRVRDFKPTYPSLKKKKGTEK